MAKIEYDVTISGADNGIVVGIGCKRLVFTNGNVAEFLTDLSIYLTKGYEGYEAMGKKYFPEMFAPNKRGSDDPEPVGLRVGRPVEECAAQGARANAGY